MHPIAELVVDAAHGRHPVSDGGWHRVPPWRTGLEAVLAFTGHAVLAVGDDVSDARLQGLGVDGLGGANHPRVLLDLAGPTGWIDSLDVLLALPVRPGTPSAEALVERPDLTDHARAHWARAVRDDVRVLGSADPARRSVAMMSRGVGGLPELSVEMDPAERGQGRAADFIRAAVATRSPGEVVVASVAPGNVASLRAFLGAGFGVVGSVQLLRPAR
jgi:RimJ/RimL family protein N-acetyltransferase